MIIEGFGIHFIVRCLGLHFLLSFVIALLVSSLIFFIKKGGNIRSSVLIGLYGGMAGLLIDADHFWTERGLHIPVLIAYSLFVFFFILFRRDRKTFGFVLVMSLWFSVAAHVLEDFTVSWF